MIAFCSDHGELLGHFGMLTKSIDEYPILYDVGLRVPMIVRSPGQKAGLTVEDSVELVDICPTLLACAEQEVAPEIQARDLSGCLRGDPAPERPYVFAESGAVKIIRGERHKLVYYPGQPYGELYDVVRDPSEVENLYDREDWREVRNQLTRDLLDRIIHTEGAIHGPSNRGEAYWRYLHSEAFQRTPHDG